MYAEDLYDLRVKVREGKKVPVEDYKKIVADLREGRKTAGSKSKGSTKKAPMTEEEKKASTAQLNSLLNINVSE